MNKIVSDIFDILVVVYRKEKKSLICIDVFILIFNSYIVINFSNKLLLIIFLYSEYLKKTVINKNQLYITITTSIQSEGVIIFFFR